MAANQLIAPIQRTATGLFYSTGCKRVPTLPQPAIGARQKWALLQPSGRFRSLRRDKFKIVDQTVGRGIVAGGLFAPGQFRKNRPGQLLAQLDAPLVKGIDIPDSALDKYLVLVKATRAPKVRGVN
ncbi:MAG: hypothetical protein R2864_10730 [Syntrophotaleaceae bacterium]